MQNSFPVLVPGDPTAVLTPAEQKQIRDTLCNIVLRGLRYPTELSDTRSMLSREFAEIKADSSKAAKGKAS